MGKLLRQPDIRFDFPKLPAIPLLAPVLDQTKTPADSTLVLEVPLLA